MLPGRLVVFTRYPTPGAAKTRLIPALVPALLPRLADLDRPEDLRRWPDLLS